MAETKVHYKEDRVDSVWLQCLPNNWPTSGELLTTGGDRNRKHQADEFREQFGPDHPAMDGLIQSIRPQESRFLVVELGHASSAIDLTISAHTSEPAVNPDEWETIEQAGAEFGDLPASLELGIAGEHSTNPTLTEMLSSIPSGWNMIRASRRGYQLGRNGAEVRIDIWPIPESADLQRIKHQPAKPERPRVGPGADVYEQWVRITTCLMRAGIGTTAEIGPKGQTAPIHPRVQDAISRARLDPKTFPFFWFHLLTGYPDDRWTNLIPGYDLLTVEQSFEVRQLTLDAWEGNGADYPEQAGEPAYAYIPEYIPLAERDAYMLVYDARPGPRHGMILEFDKVDADDDTTTWKSLTHFLGDLAFSLENRSPFLGYTPDFSENIIDWKPGN